MKKRFLLAVPAAAMSVALYSLALAVPPPGSEDLWNKRLAPYDNPKGTVVTTDLEFTPADTNDWAKKIDGTTVDKGSVKLTGGKRWVHTYAQADCPNGYTLIDANKVITERTWKGATVAFTKANITPNYTARVLENKSDVLDGWRIIRSFSFRTEGAKTYYTADMYTNDLSLLSTHKYVTAGGKLRTADEFALVLYKPENATASKWDLCEKNINEEAECGDGIVDPPEECDDDNTDSEDGCSATCALEITCGNEILEGEEQCDDGNTDDEDGCSATCTDEMTCGDGLATGTEQCDDGNTTSGDGCTGTCVYENVCGDAAANGDEECDLGDGNSDVTADTCRTSCMNPSCGDNVVDTGEWCDDGNTNGGDGCTPYCTVEGGGSSS